MPDVRAAALGEAPPGNATLGEALARATDRLRAAGSETARLDAELLLAHVLSVDRTAVLAHPEVPLTTAQQQAFSAATARRERGEPVAYIRGLKEFYGLAISVDPRALIPRPETELLVDLGVRRAAELLSGRQWRPERGRLRVVDVGTGTGAVAIAVAASLRRRKYGEWLEIVATDTSPDAIALARENAVAHGLADALRFAVADLLPDDEPDFDLVLANLPYIPAGEVPALPVAASFEPRAALDGGSDGLDEIRRLVGALASRTTDLGTALFEIAPQQRGVFGEIVAATLPGWSLRFHDDLAARTRIAEVARQPSAA